MVVIFKLFFEPIKGDPIYKPPALPRCRKVSKG